MIGFPSPELSTKELIVHILESNRCSVPVLDLLDSQLDANLPSKLVFNITEEHVIQTPPPNETEPTPEAEQAERKKKK